MDMTAYESKVSPAWALCKTNLNTHTHLEDKKYLIWTLHVICAHAHMLLNDVTQLGITVGLRHLDEETYLCRNK